MMYTCSIQIILKRAYFCLQYDEWQSKLREINYISSSENLADYILEGVTKGLSYDQIRARSNIPCCRQSYYKLRRKFFYILDSLRENNR